MSGLGPLTGHLPLRETLAAAADRSELPSALLLLGPSGVGKQRLALWLVQRLVCEAPRGPEPCDSCRGFGRVIGVDFGLVVPDGDPTRLVTAAATLSLLVGALLMLSSLLRLGFVANFISTPVLTGFKAGIGLVILLDQLPKLLGIHITKAGATQEALLLWQAMRSSAKTAQR